MRRTVEIHVEGGSVTVANRSPDVEVEIRDYDVPETDEHGNPVSDCTVEGYEAEPLSGPFCPEDGDPMRKLAEIGGGALAFYACPSCDGWTYDANQGAYIAGIPSWADELQKAVTEAQADRGAPRNLPEGLGVDGSIALYD